MLLKIFLRDISNYNVVFLIKHSMFEAYRFNLVLELREFFLIWQYQFDQNVNQKHWLFRIKLRFSK